MDLSMKIIAENLSLNARILFDYFNG